MEKQDNQNKKKTRGRNPVQDPRINIVTVRYNEEEYQKLISEYQPMKKQMELAPYIRMISLRKSKAKIINKAIISQLSMEVKRIGININQIAHQLNEKSGAINHGQISNSFKQLSAELQLLNDKISKL